MMVMCRGKVEVQELVNVEMRLAMAAARVGGIIMM